MNETKAEKQWWGLGAWPRWVNCMTLTESQLQILIHIVFYIAIKQKTVNYHYNYDYVKGCH